MRSPRVCLVNDDLFPSRWTNTLQTMKTAAALAAEGVDVELVLPRPWRLLFTSREERRRVLERYYGIDASFELTQIPGVPRTALRIDEAVHGVVGALYAVFRGHDVVYSRKIVPLAVALAFGTPVIFESHRVLRRHYPLAYRAVRLLGRHPRFAGVVTNARVIADAFVEMGFADEAVMVAQNSYDPADMEPVLDRDTARRAIGLRIDGPIVCYAGHIQARKGIGTVIAMAAAMPDVHYVVCGGFPRDVAAARAMAAASGAANVTFTGWIDVARLAPYLYAADVLLIPPASAPFETYGNTVLPIKTYSYLAAGRAILAPRQRDVAEVLHHDRNAWLVEPDRLDDAVAGARLLIEDRARAARLGAAAREDAQQYTWRARAKAIRQFIGQRWRAVREHHAAGIVPEPRG